MPSQYLCSTLLHDDVGGNDSVVMVTLATVMLMRMNAHKSMVNYDDDDDAVGGHDDDDDNADDGEMMAIKMTIVMLTRTMAVLLVRYQAGGVVDGDIRHRLVSQCGRPPPC